MGGGLPGSRPTTYLARYRRAADLMDDGQSLITDDGYREAIRFCPICHGYEAKDRRIGVLGSLAAAGKKALFLRTYARELFATYGAYASSDA